MIAFATCVTRPATYARCAAAGIAAVADADALVVEATADDGVAAGAYDEALEALAGQPGVTAIVLVDEDVLLHPDAFAAGAVALLGTEDLVADPSGRVHVLSPWAAAHVRLTAGPLAPQVVALGRGARTAPLGVHRPLVSVLVPTYEREHYLSVALRSVCEQTYPNLEILVGDNASTDGTPDVVAGFAEHDDRIVSVRRAENIRYFPNAIDLLERASGDYVQFALDDDWLLPRCVERLVDGLEAHPTADLAAGVRFAVGADGERLPGTAPDLMPLSARDALLDGIAVGDAMLRTTMNLLGAVSAVLFRRSAVPDPTGLWSLDRPMEACGDVALYLKLLSGGPCFYAAEELTAFRLHGAQGGMDEEILCQVQADWVRLIDHGLRMGFLREDGSERTAWAALARAVSVRLGAVSPVALELALGTLERATAEVRRLGLPAPARV